MVLHLWINFFYLCFVFVMFSGLFIVALWSPAGKGLTSWLSCMCFFFFVFVTFSCGVLGQVWCLIVSIPTNPTPYAQVYDVYWNFNNYIMQPPSLLPQLSLSLAQGFNAVTPVRLEPAGPSVSRQAVYHWATALIYEKASLDSSIKWIEEELNTVYRNSNAPLC